MDQTSHITIIVFVLYILGVFLLAGLSHRVLNRESFLSEYFLGSRGLGTWALAFTFAATSASGGSFGGYPSLIYSYGWILALWIGSYMVFPLTTMGVLGKRLNQVARKSGSITIPDVFRDRFDSPVLGLFASCTIIFFTLCVLVPQFKLGALIIEDTFNLRMKYSYELGLFVFATIVIVYTSFGGFRAVVWTDVMQGIVMGVGVIVLVPIVLAKTGGLREATQRLLASPPTAIAMVPAPASGGADNYNDLVFRALDSPAPVALIYRRETTPGGVLKVTWEADPQSPTAAVGRVLVVHIPFASGGPASELADRPSAGVTDPATADAASKTPPVTGNDVLRLFGASPELARQVRVEIPYKNHEFVEVDGELVDRGATGAIGFPIDSQTGQPALEQRFRFRRGAELAFGPSRQANGEPFLPLGQIISFFFIWAIAGIAQPGMMVRLMAFRDSRTLKRSMLTVTFYYAMIYVPLILIVMAARDALPTLTAEHSDRTIVLIATRLVADMGLGYQILGAIFVAAPFAAVMSTVDSFLLMISSGAVRDIYQRSINPNVSDRAIARISYATTFVAGTFVAILATHPPDFLQIVIVFVSGGFAATFLCPMLCGLYWKGMTWQGALAAMAGGFATTVFCFYPTFAGGVRFDFLGFHPTLWGLAVSFALGYIVSKLSGPPDAALVQKYF